MRSDYSLPTATTAPSMKALLISIFLAGYFCLCCYHDGLGGVDRGSMRSGNWDAAIFLEVAAFTTTTTTICPIKDTRTGSFAPAHILHSIQQRPLVKSYESLPLKTVGDSTIRSNSSRKRIGLRASSPHHQGHDLAFTQKTLSNENQMFINKKKNKTNKKLVWTLWAKSSSAEYDGDDEEEYGGAASIDPLIEDVSFKMRRVSWWSWWAQMILTVIASVTIAFTRNVMELQVSSSSQGGAAAAATASSAMLPNYFLAGSGIVLSFVSIFWTWATRRLSRRLLRKPTTRIQAATMIRKDVTFGVVVNLVGAASALVGLEQIIGGLAVKVLTTTATTASSVYAAGSSALLQPLDILLVQGNTNLMFSHFASLVANLLIGRSVQKLDPPSTEADDRQSRRK